MNRTSKKSIALMSALTALMLAIGCGIVAGCCMKKPSTRCSTDIDDGVLACFSISDGEEDVRKAYPSSPRVIMPVPATERYAEFKENVGKRFERDPNTVEDFRRFLTLIATASSEDETRLV